MVSRSIETLWLAELVEPAVKSMPLAPTVTVLLPVPPTTLMPVKVVNAEVSIITVVPLAVTPVGDPVNVLLLLPKVLTVITSTDVLVFKLVMFSDVSKVIITSVPTTETVAGLILSSNLRSSGRGKPKTLRAFLFWGLLKSLRKELSMERFPLIKGSINALR